MSFNGHRLRYFRMRKKITQKALGEMIGFPEASADVRVAQYESGSRTPKSDMVSKLANAVGVSSWALDVPYLGLPISYMHMLYAMEDEIGLQITEINGQLCLTVNPDMMEGREKAEAKEVLLRMRTWFNQAQKLRSGAISKETYDDWRYNFPTLQEDDTHLPGTDFAQDLKYLIFPQTRERDQAATLASQVDDLNAKVEMLMKMMKELSEKK